MRHLKKYQRRVQEICEAKGEVKVIEKLKKKNLQLLKDMNKKIEENREEFVVMQMSRRKKRKEL